MNKIKTWEERLEGVNSFIRRASPVLSATTCMKEEIKELRAAMGRRGWVSVADKLPDIDGMLCAVFASDVETIAIWSAIWNKEYEEFECIGGGIEAGDITHWMSLPVAPPRKEGDA